jgi:hypothetical protein
MKIIEDDNFLNKHQKEQISNGILATSFPFYWVKTQIKNANLPNLVHVLLGESLHGHIVEPNKIASPNFYFCKNVLDTFCEKHNMSYNKIHRACINLTVNSPFKNGTIHNDHKFNYTQFILYLNDSTGDTLVFKNKRKILKRIKAKQFKGAVFGKCLHAQEYPKRGRRVVLVITFS